MSCNIFDQVKRLVVGSNLVVFSCDAQTKKVQIWKKVDLTKLVERQWYDYVDKEAGSFGQCQISKKGEMGNAIQPEWCQFPIGWQTDPDKENYDYEEDCDKVSEHNERYIFLEFLGEYERVQR